MGWSLASRPGSAGWRPCGRLAVHTQRRCTWTLRSRGPGRMLRLHTTTKLRWGRKEGGWWMAVLSQCGQHINATCCPSNCPCAAAACAAGCGHRRQPCPAQPGWPDSRGGARRSCRPAPGWCITRPVGSPGRCGSRGAVHEENKAVDAVNSLPCSPSFTPSLPVKPWTSSHLLPPRPSTCSRRCGSMRCPAHCSWTPSVCLLGWGWPACTQVGVQREPGSHSFAQVGRGLVAP